MRKMNGGHLNGAEMEETVYSHVLLPLFQQDTARHLVSVACSMLSEHGTLNIIQIEEIPAGLSMNHALELEIPRDMLAKASADADALGAMPVAQVVKTRSAAEAIVEIAIAEKADLVVMGFRYRDTRERRHYCKIIRQVVKVAPCDVVTLSIGRRGAVSGRIK